MKFTTKKIDENVSQIFVNGRSTAYGIYKGDDPEWGLHREWHVMKLGKDNFGAGVEMTVYRRKSDALHAFGEIWKAAIESIE